LPPLGGVPRHDWLAGWSVSRYATELWSPPDSDSFHRPAYCPRLARPAAQVDRCQPDGNRIESRAALAADVAKGVAVVALLRLKYKRTQDPGASGRMRPATAAWFGVLLSSLARFYLFVAVKPLASH